MYGKDGWLSMTSHTLSYNDPLFFLIFLPVFVCIYGISKPKIRKWVLLVFNYVFLLFWSKKLVIWQLAIVVISWVTGKLLGHTKHKKAVLTVSILSVLGILGYLKYYNFIGSLLPIEFTAKQLAMPVGVSYYSLQAVSYVADLYNGKLETPASLISLCNYLSFFPTVVEGPITRYSELKEELEQCHGVTYDNLRIGFIRIIFGLYKKMILADRINPVVNTLFNSYTDNGFLCVLAAALCTIQLYMDFSGTIDIAIGAARMFGFILPENFRQPFFAKNASDFWRRWHITLGTFLKDYVFYPVSLSKPIRKLTKYARKHWGKTAAKFLGPSIAFFCVWMGNGVWHGPNWTYIGYGMYYFVLVLLELFLEGPLKKSKINTESTGFKIFRFIKLCIIVAIGEMFFRASTFAQGWTMFTSMFTSFQLQQGLEIIPSLGLTGKEWIALCLLFIPVIVVSVLKERGMQVEEKILSLRTPYRWAILYSIMIAVILFGAYGPGYDAVAMMYANF